MFEQPVSAGTTKIVMANYASSAFRFYISLVNEAIMTPVVTEADVDIETFSFVSTTPLQIWTFGRLHRTWGSL